MKKNAAGIEYITVAEYAKIKGVSSQAVYKQLNKRLKPFFIMVENQKCLLSTVLDEVETENSTAVEQPFNNHSTEDLNQSLIETMQKTIEVLQSQLSVKDEQIKQLNERLEQALQTVSQSHYIAASAITEGNAAETEETPQTIITTEETKKSLFAKIFKRK
jgi:TolA-binding protein